MHEDALLRLHQGEAPEQVLLDVTRLLTNKLMHAPSAQLRAAGETRQDLARAARELFGLPVEPDRKDRGN